MLKLPKRIISEKLKDYSAMKKMKKDIKKPIVAENADEVDIKEAAKLIKKAMQQIANKMAQLPFEKRVKKAKSINWMGYTVETSSGEVIVKFEVEKRRKDKTAAEGSKVEAEKSSKDEAKRSSIANDDEDEPKVEVTPAGDLYGQDGEVEDPEIVDDDDDDGNEDGTENPDDEEDDYGDGPSRKNSDYSFSTDYRDERDEGTVSFRRDFFNQYGDDYEPTDY